MFRAAALIASLLIATPLAAQETPAPAQPQAEAAMTADRLVGILLSVDPEARPSGSGIELTIDDVPVLVMIAPEADRMRAIVPIASAEALTPDEMTRILQANFDTALDARYAIAQGRLWAVFLHPLAALEREQAISGLAQTVTLAQTYGTLYSSGAQMFGRGDSGEIYENLLRDLLEGETL